jgi:hypothetical protein
MMWVVKALHMLYEMEDGINTGSRIISSFFEWIQIHKAPKETNGNSIGIMDGIR